MEPVLAGLEREGYHIERVNVERPENKAKMQQYRVDRIPTFIVLTDGRETARLVGAVPAESLKKLMAPATQARKNSPKTIPAQPATQTPVTTVTRSDRSHPDQSLIQKSVRIVVDDGKSRSFGTGTVIRSVPGETIVLTCAHLFQGVSKHAKTSVEFFGSTNRVRLAGEVLARDSEADVCLMRVTSDQAFPTARVAGKSAMPAAGQATSSVGCDNGADPTVRHMKVTAINRYVGAPTIECSGEPVEGRSGGGLFNQSGDVIGVCSARDPADHRGIYGGLAAIHTLLDRNSLASLYQPKSADSGIALAGYDKKTTPLAMPSAQAIGLKVDQDLPIPDSDNAEVVCVIRSLENPNDPPKVVLLNRATPEFLAILEKERAAQDARSSTAMRLPSRPDLQPVDRSFESTGKAMPLDPSRWRSAGKAAQSSKTDAGQEARSSVEESTNWQKNWPSGAASAEGPLRR
jgi:hypothetical protein